MKPIKMFLRFLIIFITMFIFELIFKLYIFNSDKPLTDEILSCLFQSLILSAMFTFTDILKRIKETVSPEEFEKERKKLIIYLFSFTLAGSLALSVGIRIAAGKEVKWLMVILSSVAVTSFITLISIVFSGSISKRRISKKLAE